MQPNLFGRRLRRWRGDNRRGCCPSILFHRRRFPAQGLSNYFDVFYRDFWVPLPGQTNAKKYLLMDWKRKKKSETARREISDLGDIQQRPSRYFHAALGAWLSTVVMLFSSAGPLLGALMILFDFPMASHNRLRRGILIFSHHEALSFHLASVSRRINVGAGEAADENLCHEVAEASSTQHCS